ncbi:MAG TPA: flagellar biosynthesis protein FlhB [Chthonomonadales bacterium]|nr:flagellar biosynthesis protein FlhB [Chthonomonadales bacterium]
MADDRTEAATPRKRAEVRRRGQVAKSQDLSSMVVFLGVIVCLHTLGGTSLHILQEFVQRSLAGMYEGSLGLQQLFQKGSEIGWILVRALWPIVLTAFVLGVLVSVLQTGFVISTQALVPDFNRLNPLNGLQRLLSTHGLVETLKSLGKLAIIAYIAYSTVFTGYTALLETIRKDIPSIIAFAGNLLYRLVLRIGMFLLVLAAVDYAYQRWSFERSIRMTKSEVKQEHRQHEGDPHIKARIRARQRQLARRRMMEEVPKADVVITNPTHYAVALRYDAATMAAPQVVAKGADLIAQKIREIAEEHRVPIVQNAPLARALYRQVDIGRQIPADFYAAVAEILAYVYQLNAQRGYATP